MEGTIRSNWLKAMYIANIVIAGPIGIAYLLAPETTSAIMGLPGGDPVSAGISYGAVPLAFGLAGVLGLRWPVRIAPVLILQALYKTLFLIGTVVPLALSGQVPGHAVTLVVLFVLFIVGDLIAIPFPSLLSAVPETRV